MRKIVISLIVIILLSIEINVYAEENNPSIEFNFTQSDDIKEDEISIIISLDKFNGIEEDIILGYEAIIEYDENIFEKVSVNGLNTWISEYAESTGRIIGEVSEAKQDTQITELTFKLKEDIEPCTTIIKLNDVLLTDGTNDFEYSKEIEVTISAKSDIPENSTENEIEQEKENVEETDKISIPSEKEDSTIASTILPNAGLTTICFIVITCIIIAIIVFARYKSIEIK